MTDHGSQAGTTRLQAEIVAALDLTEFTPDAYTSATYLEAALDAGFEVGDLAIAHDVTPKTIYRYLDRHDIAHEQPPKNGTARRLWDRSPDSVPGDD